MDSTTPELPQEEQVSEKQPMSWAKPGLIASILVNIILLAIVVGLVVAKSVKPAPQSTPRPSTMTGIIDDMPPQSTPGKPTSASTILPFSPNDPFVTSVSTHYAILTTIREIKPVGTDKYQVVLNLEGKSPWGFTVGKDYKVSRFTANQQSSTIISIQNAKVNDKVLFNIIYNAKKNTWDIPLSEQTNKLSN